MESKDLIPLDALADRINEAQVHIARAWSDTLGHAKEAGELLTQAKKLAGHGNWEAWLQGNCHVSVSMARKYMQLAKEWPRLVEANQEPVADLGIKDALKLLAKPRPQRGPVIIDMGVEEVVEPQIGSPVPFSEGVVPVDQPRPNATAMPFIDTPMKADDMPGIAPGVVAETRSVETLLDMLEGALLALAPKERAKVVEETINRLYGFQDQHCRDRMTLVKMREAFPGVGVKELRKEVVEFISAWRGARITKDHNHQEGITAGYAEDFIRLQKEHGWQQGMKLVPGCGLHVSQKVEGKGSLIDVLDKHANEGG